MTAEQHKLLLDRRTPDLSLLAMRHHTRAAADGNVLHNEVDAELPRQSRRRPPHRGQVVALIAGPDCRSPPDPNRSPARRSVPPWTTSGDPFPRSADSCFAGRM